jgi:hypothetical protein
MGQSLWIERVSVPKVADMVVFYDGEPLDGPIDGNDAPDPSIVLMIKESELKSALLNLDDKPKTVVDYSNDPTN